MSSGVSQQGPHVLLSKIQLSYFWLFLNSVSLSSPIAKLRKATISFVMSVRPCVCMEQLDTHWKDFMKFNI